MKIKMPACLKLKKKVFMNIFFLSEFLQCLHILYCSALKSTSFEFMCFYSAKQLSYYSKIQLLKTKQELSSAYHT